MCCDMHGLQIPIRKARVPSYDLVRFRFTTKNCSMSMKNGYRLLLILSESSALPSSLFPLFYILVLQFICIFRRQDS
jgi:hypothetical protein